MTQKVTNLLGEGDVITLGIGHKVYAKVPRHFLYSNAKGDFEKDEGLITIEGHFDYFAGNYIVIKTITDGGGTGHGAGDVYPDGHHVFCENAKDPNLKLNFYQTGCFTAMIEDIKPIGRAKKKWVFEKCK